MSARDQWRTRKVRYGVRYLSLGLVCKSVVYSSEELHYLTVNCHKAPHLEIMQQNPAHVQHRPTSIPTFTVPCVTQAVSMTTLTTTRKQIVYSIYILCFYDSEPMKARGKFYKLFLGPSKLTVKLYKHYICTYIHFWIWIFQIKCHMSWTTVYRI